MANIRIASSQQGDTPQAMEELAATLEGCQLVIVFFHGDLDARELSAAAGVSFRGARVVGCSTSGAIGPDGPAPIVAVGFSRPARASVVHLPDVEGWRFASASMAMAELTRGLGMRASALDPARHVLLCLGDGLSTKAELLAASLGEVARGVSILGASAADARRSGQTWTFVDGEALPSSAVVILLEPGVSFVPFVAQDVAPLPTRVVVTEVGKSASWVVSLDGRPAVEVFAELAGVDADDLRTGRVQAHTLPVQLAVAMGEQLLLRGVLEVEGDALHLGGTVSRGGVLRCGQVGGGQAAIAQAAIAQAQVRKALGTDVSACLLFGCADQPSGMSSGLVAGGWPTDRIAGFSTFGVQYAHMHMTHALVGLALGS
jgi:hypothetical protein